MFIRKTGQVQLLRPTNWTCPVFLPQVAWFQRDPLGYTSTKCNLYEYVAGSPLLYVDPSGMRRPGETFVDCVKRILCENGVYLTIADLIIYALCVAGCGTVTGGVGIVPCLGGCLVAVGVGNGIGITLACLGGL